MRVEIEERHRATYQQCAAVKGHLVDAIDAAWSRTEDKRENDM